MDARVALRIEARSVLGSRGMNGRTTSSAAAGAPCTSTPVGDPEPREGGREPLGG